jgi:hypothetical protein
MSLSAGPKVYFERNGVQVPDPNDAKSGTALARLIKDEA